VKGVNWMQEARFWGSTFQQKSHRSEQASNINLNSFDIPQTSQLIRAEQLTGM
jgi:hypothetical protein